MPIVGWYLQLATQETNEGDAKIRVETTLIDLGNDPGMPFSQIKADARYPYQYMPHPTLPNYYALKIHLGQDPLIPNIRPLTVQWGTKIPKAWLGPDGRPKYDDDPTARPASITFGDYKTTKNCPLVYARFLPVGATDADADSDYNQFQNNLVDDVQKDGSIKLPTVPPKNTAGDLLHNVDQVAFRTISFSKNVKILPLFLSKAGMFINSDVVKIRGASFARGTLLATDIHVSDYEFENGVPYLIFSWNYYVDEVDKWLIKKRNCGFNEKVVRYLDDKGNTVPAPVPGGKKTHVLAPIEVGPIDNRQIPSTPVLLRPNGRALRAKRKGDSDDPTTWTGEIMSSASRNDDDRDQAQKDADWANSIISIRNKPIIPFNKYFPMT